MVTSDGQLHWDTFRPTSTTYDFRPMDEYVAFAKKHGMAIEGHHLTWEEDNSLPKWLKSHDYTKDELLGLMREHIGTVVGRYKGVVKQWTVVNEPFTRAQHVYGLDSWWTDHAGVGYIDQAFIAARQADPDAKLILNDFYNETKTPVSDAQYEYMKSAKERGIPIDGFGVQLHVDTARPPEYAAMVENMKRFVGLGYGVYITEFDINSSNAAGSKQEIAAQEAKIAADVVHACLDSGGCKSITNFGMADKILYEKRYTRGGERSYLLDSRYRPKASFNAFRNALLQPTDSLQ
jgi:endo-1,4-beta-xylanase